MPVAGALIGVDARAIVDPMPRALLFVFLIVSVLFVAAGIGMVATGAEGGWPAVLFFGLCGATFIGQLWPDILRREGPGADDLLAKFPGPVDLRTDRRKTALLLLASLVFGGVILWMLVKEPPGLWRGIFLWSGLVLCGLSVPMLALLLVRGGGLRLTAQALELRHLRGVRVMPWRNLGGFEVGRIPPSFTPVVRYDDASKAAGPFAGINSALMGRNSGLPDSYGMSHDDLARLLNGWRLKALAGSAGPRR